MFLFAALSACGPATEGMAGLAAGAPDSAAPDSAGSDRQEIRAGSSDPDDPAVFMLLIDYPNGDSFLCSATLVGRRTLLTAAHCVEEMDGHPPSRLRAHDLPQMPALDSPDWIEGVDHLQHPDWDPGNIEHSADLALVLLARDPPVKRIPLSRVDPLPYLGAPVRVLGYGIVDLGSDHSSGTRRQVRLQIRSVDRNHLSIGDPGLGAICNGDSGGPTLLTFPDGVERHAGIHSFLRSSDSCQGGNDVRTDAYASFVDLVLAQWEAATCSADGACSPGCAPVDPDCACVADGACAKGCADPSKDPDCAQACARNGICGTACPDPDPDCRPPFSGCDATEDCASRLCVSDPQSFGSYCSQPCGDSAMCPSGLECTGGACTRLQLPAAGRNEPCTEGQTFCTGGLTCTGPEGSQTSCLQQCFVDLGCPNGCEPGQNGVSFCRPESGDPRSDGDPGGCGCHTGSGSGAALGAAAVLLLWMRKREGRSFSAVAAAPVVAPHGHRNVRDAGLSSEPCEQQRPEAHDDAGEEVVRGDVDGSELLGGVRDECVHGVFDSPSAPRA